MADDESIYDHIFAFFASNRIFIKVIYRYLIKQLTKYMKTEICVY